MYLDLQTLADRLGVTAPTLSRLAKNGGFPKPVKIGRQLRFNPLDVAKWEADQRGVPLTDASIPAFNVGDR